MAPDSHEPRSRRPQGFIGRTRELELLRASIEEAISGGAPAAWMLVGPPGIGKTALAEALAADLASLGVEAYWGACHESRDVPALWPWKALLRALFESRPEDELSALMEGADLVIRQLASGPGGEPSPDSRTISQPGEARFQLFDSVATFLARASKRRPLLLVLDDIHWADPASLELLLFLCRHLRGQQIAIVGTYRELELQRLSEVDRVLGDLARTSRHLPLGGLPEDAVRTLVEAQSRAPVSGDFVRAVWDRTDGNPFFVDELVRLLLREGGVGDARDIRGRMPTHVETTIRQHLRHLPDELRGVLAVASAFGRSFDVSLLAAVCEVGETELASLFDDRIAIGVLEPDARRPGHYRFCHVLLQQCLYNDLEASGRARIHDRLAATLEERPGAPDEERVAALAHHTLLAGGRDERAVEYARQAGRRAQANHAYLQAADYFAKALEVHERACGDAETRLELLLLHAEALLDHGNLGPSEELFTRAFSLARELGDADAIGRAALGVAGGGEDGLTGRPERAALLEDAVQLLDGPESASVRCQVASRLAEAIYFSAEDLERPIALARDALATAREQGDPRTIALVLDSAHWVVWQPDNAEERLAMCDEFLALAIEVESRGLAVRAHTARIESLVELGEFAAAESELDVMARVSDELGQRRSECSVLFLRALLATLRGDYAIAEDHARAALALGQDIDPSVATEWFYVQYFLLREAQGRQSEILSPLRDLARERPMPAVRAGLARMLLRDGSLDEAKPLYAALVAGGVETLRRDVNWPFTMACLGEVAVAMGDLKTVALVDDLLRPLEGRQIILGLKLGWSGSATLQTAQLAGALGRWDEAFARIDLALAEARRLDSRPARLEAEIACIRLHLARGEADDRGEAHRRMEPLRALAAEIGSLRRLEPLAELLAEQPDERLGERLGERGEEREIASEPKAGSLAAEASFDLRGDYWEVAYGTRSTRLRDARGLGQLARLLREPGREFHALDLFAPGEGGAASANSDAGPWLDPRAKAEYGRRMADLRESLQQAERIGDELHARACAEELDMLAREFSRHVGLGGRDRTGAGPAERARVNVTRTIRSAIDKLEPDLPELARYLRRTVQTGLYSRFEPDPDAHLEISV